MADEIAAFSENGIFENLLFDFGGRHTQAKPLGFLADDVARDQSSPGSAGRSGMLSAFRADLALHLVEIVAIGGLEFLAR